MKQKIRDILQDSISTKERILEKQIDTIYQITLQVISCLKKRGKIFFFGNGGSAADSQHLASEFVGRFQRERDPLPAISLTTDTSIITSLSNDYNFEIIFSRQIEAMGKKGDLAIGITTSGRSKNVILGLKKAREMGLKTIVFTGKGGKNLKNFVDICLAVPSSITARIQEAHITIGHIICELVEKTLFKDKDS
jgi:D-sedoheptulose 7-phosphate isomerase